MASVRIPAVSNSTHVGGKSIGGGGGGGGARAEVTQQKLLRRPTLVRKYAESNLDNDSSDCQTPSSPTKRVKVAFNDEVEINLVEEWERDPELTREEVRRALTRHHDGDDTHYDELKEVFMTSTATRESTDTPKLRRYTMALLQNIGLINTRCSDLVQLMIKSNWVRRDDAYAALFLRFLENLLLSQPMWLSPVLHALVDNFLQSHAPVEKGLAPVSPRQIRTRSHKILQSILKLIPSGSSALAHVINTRFPLIHDSKRVHVRYVHNLLQIIQYAPQLRSEVSGLIIDRVVKIDVQVQVDIEDLADDAGEDIVKAITQSAEAFIDDESSDEDSDASSSDSDSDSDSDATAPEASTEKVVSNIEKLDIVLDIMFGYYTTLFSNPATYDAALDSLLSHFISRILPTYQSRHTQFLLFHFLQSSPELIDIFIGTLLRTVSDRTKAPLIRQTSASYLASFVARGTHVPPNIVQDVFDYISLQLSELRSQYISGYSGPDPHRYGTYYALCQALFYIFCFRWRDLQLSPYDNDNITPSPRSALYPNETTSNGLFSLPKFPPIIKETFLLHCFKGLNPLKVCAPSISSEFARITHLLEIIYIYPSLESNKRIRIVNNTPLDHRGTALTHGKTSTEWQGLDAYFPFDPYKLPRSKRWLQGDYRDWKPMSDEPGALEQDDGASESDSSEDEGGDEGGSDDDDDDVEGSETGTEGGGVALT